MGETEFARAERYWRKTCTLTKRIDTLETRLSEATALLERSKEQLKKDYQFMTWLCEDSTKYPGTDAGDAARLDRHFVGVMIADLEKFNKENEK